MSRTPSSFLGDSLGATSPAASTTHQTDEGQMATLSAPLVRTTTGAPPLRQPAALGVRHVACARCRSSKIRCDGTGTKPCSSCVKSGDNCVYAPRRQRRSRPASGSLMDDENTSVRSPTSHVETPSRVLGSVTGDLDWLTLKHWHVPAFNSNAGSSAVALAGHHPVPTGSFIAAAFKALPAIQAANEAALRPGLSTTSPALIAQSLRSSLEAELPRLFSYVSITSAPGEPVRRDPNPATALVKTKLLRESDLSLLFALVVLTQLFAATGHVQMADKVIDASNSVVSRVAAVLMTVGPADVGGEALYFTWLRATWIAVHLEFNRAILTGRSESTFALLQQLAPLRFQEPLHYFLIREYQKRAEKGIVPQIAMPPIVDLPPVTFGELSATLFADPSETQRALLASHYGLLQHRGAIPILAATEYLSILAGSLCQADRDPSLSMLNLLTNNQHFRPNPEQSPDKHEPFNATPSSSTQSAAHLARMATRAKIIRAIEYISTSLPESIRMADEAGDIVALSQLSDTWFFPAGQNGLAPLVHSLAALHLAGIRINSPKPFTDKEIWTAAETSPERLAWMSWMSSPEFVEACAHAIVLARYAKTWIKTMSLRTVSEHGGYVIAVVAMSTTPNGTFGILNAAWVLVMYVTFFKQTATGQLMEPSGASLAREVENDARACLDFVLVSPWKQFHQPALSLQRMLVTPLLGPKDEDLAILKHVVDSV